MSKLSQTETITQFKKVHGSFFQTPSSHKRGAGCHSCSPKKISKIKRDNKTDVINSFKETRFSANSESIIDIQTFLTSEI